MLTIASYMYYFHNCLCRYIHLGMCFRIHVLRLDSCFRCVCILHAENFNRLPWSVGTYKQAFKLSRLWWYFRRQVIWQHILFQASILTDFCDWIYNWTWVLLGETFIHRLAMYLQTHFLLNDEWYGKVGIWLITLRESFVILINICTLSHNDYNVLPELYRKTKSSKVNMLVATEHCYTPWTRNSPWLTCWHLGDYKGTMIQSVLV